MRGARLGESLVEAAAQPVVELNTIYPKAVLAHSNLCRAQGPELADRAYPGVELKILWHALFLVTSGRR